jgi:hypothetical protein
LIGATTVLMAFRCSSRRPAHRARTDRTFEKLLATGLA